MRIFVHFFEMHYLVLSVIFIEFNVMLSRRKKKRHIPMRTLHNEVPNTFSSSYKSNLHRKKISFDFFLEFFIFIIFSIL